jgi:hypothetical protein
MLDHPVPFTFIHSVAKSTRKVKKIFDKISVAFRILSCYTGFSGKEYGMIQQISETKFSLDKGPHTMILTKDLYGWNMVTENPCTRAWKGKMGSYRHFSNLAEVEAHYKSWKGISALVEA